MTTTITQRARFRAAVGDKGGNRPDFPDPEIDDIFAQAEELQTGENANVIFAQAVILGIEAYMARAAKRVSYRQSESSESLSDLTGNYESLLAYWNKKLTQAKKEGASSSVKSGVGWNPIRGQQSKKEFPNA